MRRDLLLEAAMLDARDEELACDLAGDLEGVDRCKARLDELLDAYCHIPQQRQP